MNKKKSRPITIDNQRYRYQISGFHDHVILVVEMENAKGTIITVHVNTDIDRYWLEFPYTKELNLKVVTPKDVADIIQQAKKNGWIPEAKGKPLNFKYIDNNLIAK